MNIKVRIKRCRFMNGPVLAISLFLVLFGASPSYAMLSNDGNQPVGKKQKTGKLAKRIPSCAENAAAFVWPLVFDFLDFGEVLKAMRIGRRFYSYASDLHRPGAPINTLTYMNSSFRPSVLSVNNDRQMRLFAYYRNSLKSVSVPEASNLGISFADFAGLVNLESLTLEDLHTLSPADKQILRTLTRLKVLKLDSVGLKLGADFWFTLQNMELRVLSLNNWHNGSEDEKKSFSEFASSPAGQRLESLSLRNRRVEMSDLGQLSSLRHLSIGNEFPELAAFFEDNLPGKINDDEIKGLSGLRQLEDLSLYHSNLTRLDALVPLKRLFRLSLTQGPNSIQLTMNEILNYLNNAPQLGVLELKKMRFSKHELEQLAGFLAPRAALKLKVTVPRPKDVSQMDLDRYKNIGIDTYVDYINPPSPTKQRRAPAMANQMGPEGL
jgi:hypothetical protein